MKRREYLAVSGTILGALSAGCFRNDSGESTTGGGSSNDETDCDPIRTLEVYPAIVVPDGEPRLDAGEAGLLEVDLIERVLEQAYQEDSDELRERIDSSEQDDPDSRLAEMRVPPAEADAVQDRLGGLTYVNYRDRDYALSHVMTVC